MGEPSFRLDGQAALVTGAASGIGRAIAAGLAGAGASVACADLEGADFDGVLAEVTAAGGDGLAVATDVTDAASVDVAVEQAQQALGPLRLAVNSAGIASGVPALELSAEEWQRMLDVNLTGVFTCCQREGRAMLAAGGGAIVNIASMSGTIANRGLEQAHYNVSKAGVAHLSRSLAMEWATDGVRVNTISPGYTATPMNTRPDVASAVARFESETPMGRMARPEEMVGPAIFLLSEAASFVTGVDLLVDGGFTCW